MIHALSHALVALLASAHALPSFGGCADGQVSVWLKTVLKPALRRPTQTFVRDQPAVTPDVRLAFDRYVKGCDEKAYGAERQILTRQLEERQVLTEQILKQLTESLPRAVEKCAGPSRDACVADVRRAFQVREQAVRTAAEASRADLERQRASLKLALNDAFQIIDGVEVLDAFAKAFTARLPAHPGLNLHAIEVVDGDDFRSSWRVHMDVSYGDRNFDYVTRVNLNLYQRVTKATLAQVRALGEAAAAIPPARVETVNTNSLIEALNERRPGRGVSWLARGPRAAGQVGVLETVSLKALRSELRP